MPTKIVRIEGAAFKLSISIDAGATVAVTVEDAQVEIIEPAPTAAITPAPKPTPAVEEPGDEWGPPVPSREAPPAAVKPPAPTAAQISALPF